MQAREPENTPTDLGAKGPQRQPGFELVQKIAQKGGLRPALETIVATSLEEALIRVFSDSIIGFIAYKHGCITGAVDAESGLEGKEALKKIFCCGSGIVTVTDDVTLLPCKQNLKISLAALLDGSRHVEGPIAYTKKRRIDEKAARLKELGVSDLVRALDGEAAEGEENRKEIVRVFDNALGADKDDEFFENEELSDQELFAVTMRQTGQAELSDEELFAVTMRQAGQVDDRDGLISLSTAREPQVATKQSTVEYDPQLAAQCKEVLSTQQRLRSTKEFIQASPVIVRRPRTSADKVGLVASISIAVLLGGVISISITTFLNNNQRDAQLTQDWTVAMNLLQDGQFKAARKKLSEVILVDSRDAEAFFYRAIIAAKLGDDQQAIEDYTSAIALRRDKALAYVGRAASYLKESKYSQAIADCDKAARLGKGEQILGIRSVALANNGKFERALLDCDEALKSKSQNMPKADIYATCGYIHFKQKNYEKAFSDFSSAIKIEPNNGERYLSRGRCLLELGRLAEGKRDLDKAVYWQPRDGQSWLMRGKCCQALGQNDVAMSCFDRAIVLEPSYETYMTRARLSMEDGRKKAAATDLETALSFRPKDNQVSQLLKIISSKQK